MIESFIVYFSLMLVLFGLTYKADKVLYTDAPYKRQISNVLLAICIIIFAIVFGIRWDVGIDHLSYKVVYEKFAIGIERRKTLEPGFEFLNKFLAANGFHFSFYFGLLAALQLFFVLYAFKDKRYIIPFLMIILMAGQFTVWMNLVRQEVVICLSFWLIVTIKDRTFLNYSLWILICAFCLHKSALILIPFYFVIRSRKNYVVSLKFQVLIFLVCIGLGYTHYILTHLGGFGNFAGTIGYDQYSRIEDAKVFFQKDYNWGMRSWATVLIALGAILLSDKVKAYIKDKTFISFYNFFFWGICISVVCTGVDVVSRLFLYFSAMSFPVYGYTLYYVRKSRKESSSNYLRYLGFCALIALVFAGTIYTSSLPDGHVKYQVFWNHD